MSARAPSARWSTTTGGARAALAALPDLARRGGASRAARVHSRQDAERELKAAKALGVAFVALGEPDYPPRLQIKQGATLVTDAADVSAVLRPILGKPVELRVEEPEAPSGPGAEPGAGERARIVGLLGPTPVPIDDLVRLSGSSPAIVRVVLLELELAGRLERHGGALVSLL